MSKKKEALVVVGIAALLAAGAVTPFMHQNAPTPTPTFTPMQLPLPPAYVERACASMNESGCPDGHE